MQTLIKDDIVKKTTLEELITPQKYNKKEETIILKSEAQIFKEFQIEHNQYAKEPIPIKIIKAKQTIKRNQFF